MGTARAPVAGSGRWPAWRESVSKRGDFTVISTLRRSDRTVGSGRYDPAQVSYVASRWLGAEWTQPRGYTRRNMRAKKPPDLLAGGAAHAGEAIPGGDGAGSGERVGTLPRAARMRSGVKGCANALAPNGFSASLMAFMTAAGAPAVPASPVIHAELGDNLCFQRVNEAGQVDEAFARAH